jgi:hypothetical protein
LNKLFFIIQINKTNKKKFNEPFHHRL